jgi:thiol-disulfide isomerase/thioredoxin
LTGKPASLWLWAPWCLTCEAEAPAVAKAAQTHLGPTRVAWRLDHAKAAEISEDLAALSCPRDSDRTAGHFYVDMTSPAETLVISRDEYTDRVYPWVPPE